jgi:2-oxoglutarate dehydrogenase complex dehydrogenase (E1) component-like enzyme
MSVSAAATTAAEFAVATSVGVAADSIKYRQSGHTLSHYVHSVVLV